jgi:hypothetical protein
VVNDSGLRDALTGRRVTHVQAEPDHVTLTFEGGLTISFTADADLGLIVNLVTVDTRD